VAAEPGPELFVVDHDQAGELAVAADQVEAKACALDVKPAGLVGEPAHRFGQPARVHRVGTAQVGFGAVNVVAAEQLFFHLASERGTDLRVGPVVDQRLMEAFRDDGEPASRVEHAAGALLHEEDVIGRAVGRCWPCDRTQRECPAAAQPAGHVEHGRRVR
jgi:hypothetical protein